jgi:hypothetical protein
MRRVAAKFVPRLLSDDQKSRRLGVCEELKQRVEMEPHFMSRIITDQTLPPVTFSSSPESK